MAIALRAAQGSNNAGGGTSITMTVPAGVVDGDVMVMQITRREQTAMTTPSGWTAVVGLSTSTTLRDDYFWRVASSEPASYAITLPVTTKASGTIIGLSQGDSTAPLATQSNARANASSATVSYTDPATDWSTTKGATLAFASTAVGTTVLAAPASFTEPTNGESASTGGQASTRCTSAVFYELVGESASTTHTSTFNAAAVNGGTIVFIKEGAVVVVVDPTFPFPGSGYYGT